MLIKRSGVDAQVREEASRRAFNRRQEDIRRGITIANVPQRGDFGYCRELDKTIKDFHKFNDPKDKAKIQAEYFGKQKEFQKNHVLGK